MRLKPDRQETARPWIDSIMMPAGLCGSSESVSPLFPAKVETRNARIRENGYYRIFSKEISIYEIRNRRIAECRKIDTV